MTGTRVKMYSCLMTNSVLIYFIFNRSSDRAKIRASTAFKQSDINYLYVRRVSLRLEKNKNNIIFQPATEFQEYYYDPINRKRLKFFSIFSVLV